MLIGLNAITKELVLACRQLGLVISDTLAAYVASTIVNPTTNSFFINKPLEEADARIVVEESIKLLFAKNDPVVETLKMQVAYETKYQLCERNKKEKQDEEKKLEEGLLEQITNTKASFGEDFESMLKVYKLIFQLLKVKNSFIMKQNLKPEKKEQVEREISAALESVFPRTEIFSFMALTPPEKRTQLFELVAIVLGIRLFNLKNLPEEEHLLPCVESSALFDAEKTVTVITELQERIDQEASSVNKYYEYLFNAKHLETSLSKRDMEKHSNDLVFHNQVLSYLWVLHDEITLSLERSQAYITKYMDCNATLEAYISDKSSVQKKQVYPAFNSLSISYLDALREIETLNSRSTLFTQLKDVYDKYLPQLTEDQVIESREIQLKNVPEPIESCPVAEKSEAGDEAPQKLIMDQTPKFLDLNLDFQGFCIFTLAHRGLLTQGNPLLGVMKYKNHHMVFRSEQGIQNFSMNAQWYVQQVHQACQKNPALVNLLQLQEMFPKQALSNITVTKEVSQADVGTETPLHFIESNIDKSYEWNCWEMRKKAIHIANIRKMKTRSSQTFLSSFRREMESQTYLPKEKATNTAKDNGQNPVRIKRYITGLRNPRSYVKVVDMKYEP